jgi:N,N'-diacetyllegionaminate synthase
MNKQYKCFVIAEAGVNHNGSEKIALELVEIAAKSGADAIKFQSFKADLLVLKGTKTANYQRKNTANDDQFEMLKNLEISDEFHKKLIDHCHHFGIEFMSTPFDIGSAKFLISLGMKRIKIPSGELTNLPFIRELAAFNKPLILSTGMADLAEVENAVETVKKVRKELGFDGYLKDNLSILHCTSSYPAESKDVNLKAIDTLSSNFGLPVGYSDHTDGTLMAPVAVAMGATIIEKHFTLNRGLPGPDHLASLEPGDLNKMVKQISQVCEAIGTGIKQPTNNESLLKKSVRRSIVLKNVKQKGEVIHEDDIIMLRPGTGISPAQLDLVVGRKLNTFKESGSILNWVDFDNA